MIRDAVEFSDSIDAAVERLYKDKRTIKIRIGIGASGSYEGVNSSHNMLETFTAANYTGYTAI